MSYLADGLNQGYQSGFAAGTQRKRDKKQQEDQIKRDADMLIAQKDLMKEKDLLDRANATARNTFTADESQKDRDMRVNLQTGEQGWRSGETDKELKARADQVAAQQGLERERMTQTGDQFNRKMAQDGLQFDATLGLNKEKFAYEKDPANPENKSRSAYAQYQATRGGNFGGFEDSVTPPPANGPRPGAIVEQNGVRYKFDGEKYIPIK